MVHVCASLQVWGVVGSLFQNEVNVIQLHHPSQQDANQLKERLAKGKSTVLISEGATGVMPPAEKGESQVVDHEANVETQPEQTNTVLSVLSR